MAEKDFVTICVACSQGVTREEMKYVNGQVFHNQCYEQQGKNFVAANEDLLNQSANAKVELVLLKNLKARNGNKTGIKKVVNKKRKTKSKTKKKKTKKRSSKLKKKSSKKRRMKKKTSKNKRKSSKRTLKRKTRRRR